VSYNWSNLTSKCTKEYVEPSGTQIFQKSKNHLKILGVRSRTRNKSNTKEPQILGTTVQNLVARNFCTAALVNF
jgi:hypothetical protein